MQCAYDIQVAVPELGCSVQCYQGSSYAVQITLQTASTLGGGYHSHMGRLDIWLCMMTNSCWACVNNCVPEGNSSPRLAPSIPALLLPIPVPVPDPVPGAARAPCLGPDAAVPLPLALSRELVLATTGMSCLDWRMTNSSRRALLLEGAGMLL